MTKYVLDFDNSTDPCILATSVNRLLDTGADFAIFSTLQKDWVGPRRSGIIRYTNTAEFVDGELRMFEPLPCADLSRSSRRN